MAIGILWFLSSLLISIINDSCVKILGTDLSEYQIVFLRFSMALLLLLPIIFTRYGRVDCTHIWLHLCRGGLTAIGMLMWCNGLRQATLMSSTIMGFMIPFFVLFLSRMLLKETLEPYKIGACILGFCGACVSVYTGEAFSLNGHFLTGAILFAAIDVFNKKFVTQDNMLAMMIFLFLGAALVTFIPAMQHWQPISLYHFRILCLLSLGTSGILFALLKAFSLLELSFIAPFRFLELLISITFGFLLFGEIPTLWMLIGSFIVSCSVVILTLKATLSE